MPDNFEKLIALGENKQEIVEVLPYGLDGPALRVDISHAYNGGSPFPNTPRVDFLVHICWFFENLIESIQAGDSEFKIDIDINSMPTAIHEIIDRNRIVLAGNYSSKEVKFKVYPCGEMQYEGGYINLFTLLDNLKDIGKELNSKLNEYDLANSEEEEENEEDLETIKKTINNKFYIEEIKELLKV